MSLYHNAYHCDVQSEDKDTPLPVPDPNNTLKGVKEEIGMTTIFELSDDLLEECFIRYVSIHARAAHVDTTVSSGVCVAGLGWLRVHQHR